MTHLPYSLFSAAQTRELDRLAIEEFGISGNILMERAGDAAFSLLRRHWPKARRIAVFCGTGNNGGDGYVVARLAKEQGLDVAVYQVGDKNKVHGDALSAMQRMLGAEVTAKIYTDQPLADFDVIVDGLLGTGIKGQVASDYRSAIQAINESGQPVLALDIPSGLNTDTGVVCGEAVKATFTLTFIGLKAGLLTSQAPEYTGKVHYAGLNIPEQAFSRLQPVASRLDYSSLKNLLPLRRRDAHKGEFGHVLVIGGDSGMSGAVRLCAEAALRCGAGLVSVATREQHAAMVSAQRPEIMSHGVEHADKLAQLMERASVLVIGPGLGQGNWSEEMLATALTTDKPVIMDADALNIIAAKVQFDSLIRAQNRIFTPHPGEAARLLEQSGQQIQSNRFKAVQALVDEYAGVWVLKGAGSLIASDEGIALCHAGNPGLASGGMGDVLSGVIAALVAQKLDGVQAAHLGVCLHAEAADAAVRSVGERGLLASDLMSWLRRLANPIPHA